MKQFSKLFVMMKINSKTEEGKALREKFFIRGVPTVVVLDPKGAEIDRIVGYDEREPWVRELLGYAFNVGTLADVKARAEEKKSGKLFYKTAQKYYERGSYDDSLAYVAKARSDAKDLSELKDGLALLEGECLLQKDPEKGRSILTAIAAGDNAETSEAAFDDLVRHYRKLKSDDDIIALYKKILPKKGGDKEFLNSYAWTFAEIGKELESAAEAARKAVELSKDDPQILDTLAEVYYKMGKKQLAIETIEKAIAKEPEDEYYKEQKQKFLE